MGKDPPSFRPGGQRQSRPQAGSAPGLPVTGSGGAGVTAGSEALTSRANLEGSRPMTVSDTGAKRFYITTPIYYVNAAPHIGHAYTTMACDVMARFKRLDGYDVHFLTGTDEHGQKVQKSAAAAGTDPKSFTDRVSQSFRDLAAALGASCDDFIRTTEQRHIEACQAIWKAIEAKGDIYLGSYSGWYSVRDEAFYGEEELREENGRRIAPTGAEVEWVEGPGRFFRLKTGR